MANRAGALVGDRTQPVESLLQGRKELWDIAPCPVAIDDRRNRRFEIGTGEPMQDGKGKALALDESDAPYGGEPACLRELAGWLSTTIGSKAWTEVLVRPANVEIVVRG